MLFSTRAWLWSAAAAAFMTPASAAMIGPGNEPSELGVAGERASAVAVPSSTIFVSAAAMTDIAGNDLEFGAASHAATLLEPDSPASARAGRIGTRYAIIDAGDAGMGALAVSVSFGNTVKYKYDLYGSRTLDGAQRNTIVDGIAPSVAFQVNDSFSVGLGVSAQRFQTTISNALDEGAAWMPPGKSGDGAFGADRWAVSYFAGVSARAWEGSRFGVSYRALGAEGSREAGPEYVTGQLAVPSSYLGFDAIARRASQVDLSLTQRFNSNFAIAWDVQLTDWTDPPGEGDAGGPASVASSQDRYRESWTTSLGAAYRAGHSWTWRGGLGWDQTPVKEEGRAFGLPDGDRYTVSLGVGYEVSPGSSFDLAYTHYFVPQAGFMASGADPFAATALDADFLGGSMTFRY